MGVETTRASPVLPTAFGEALTLHQRDGGATSRLRAYGDLLTAAGAGSWKEVKWVWEAKGVSPGAHGMPKNGPRGAAFPWL